jgi:hypothetical protein
VLAEGLYCPDQNVVLIQFLQPPYSHELAFMYKSLSEWVDRKNSFFLAINSAWMSPKSESLTKGILADLKLDLSLSRMKKKP